MTEMGSFENEEVLGKAIAVTNQHRGHFFDIVSDYDLKYSYLEGHVFAIYDVDDAGCPIAIIPYFDGLRTYNVRDYFEIPTCESYYIVDLTEHTGLDFDVDDYSVARFKKLTMPRKVNKQVEIASRLVEEDSDDRFQGVLGEQLTNDCLEVESDIEVDIKIEEVPVDNDFEIVKKVNKNNSDYSVAGFKKLTESRDECEYTPIEEAMEEVGFYEEEDKVNQPSHYTSGDIEVIEYIEQQAKVMYDSGTVPPEVIPHICNAIKYISRFQSKGKAVEDLQKSVYYINRAIKNIENSKE